jgi:hypothetical protein
MAFRKSRRLRRNLRKSIKKRNRSRYYRGGGPKEDAQSLVDANNVNDPTFGELAVNTIKQKRYSPIDLDNIDSQHTMTTNVIYLLKKRNIVVPSILVNYEKTLAANL